MKSLESFLKEALAPVSGQRKGQAFMNRLAVEAPELHEGIVGSRERIDPFYDDGKLWGALEFVKEHWDALAEAKERLK